MPRKNVLTPVELVTNHSLSADFNSPATVINFNDNMAYQINVRTTDSHGTFAVQGSIDYVEPNPLNGSGNPGSWAMLLISGTPTVAAADDTILINLNQLPYSAIRLAYTSTVPGTGHADIYIMGKQV